MENKNEDKIKAILSSIPDKFNIMEQGINLKVQNEYIELSDKFTINDFEVPSINEKCEKIIMSSTDLIEKKKAIVKLGNIGTVKSYKILEKLYNQVNEELRDWILLAIQENIMFLENYINDENTGMISTGLGGIGNKLRYYFVVISKNNEPFTKLQQKIIKTEYEIICKENGADIEKIGFNFDYADFTILMPLNVALDTIVTVGLKRCNEFGDFIVEYYYATNVEIPTIDELKKIINEHLRDTTDDI